MIVENLEEKKSNKNNEDENNFKESKIEDININTQDQFKESINQEEEYKFEENISENKSKSKNWKLNESFPAGEVKNLSKSKQNEEKGKSQTGRPPIFDGKFFRSKSPFFGSSAKPN